MHFDMFTIYANKVAGDSDIKLLRGYIVLGGERYDFEALFYSFEVGTSKNVRAWFTEEAEARLRKKGLGPEAVDHLVISLQNRLLAGDMTSFLYEPRTARRIFDSPAQVNSESSPREVRGFLKLVIPENKRYYYRLKSVVCSPCIIEEPL